MANFWEVLNPPVPFYTKKNVPETIEYINNLPPIRFGKYIKCALEWVLAVLIKEPFAAPAPDVRILKEARESAEQAHDKAVLERDFIGAVRWRYAMAAVSDYINYMRGVRR